VIVYVGEFRMNFSVAPNAKKYVPKDKLKKFFMFGG